MLNMIKKLKIVSVLSALLFLVGCLQDAATSNTSGYSGLTITGQVLDTNGKAPTQAFLFVEGLRQNVPFVANGGSYQIQLSSAQLNQIRASLSNIRSFFYIYAETAQGASGTKGMSEKVFFNENGIVTNLNIQLKDTVRFLGQVSSVTGDGNPQPVAGAVVTAGSWRTVTDTNGQFMFEALPKGSVSITVTADRMEIKNVMMEVKELDTPLTIWMFPFVGLSGVMSPVDMASANPYQANYSVDWSSEVRYMRFHVDPNAFGNDFDPGQDLNSIEQQNPTDPSVDGVPSQIKAPWIPVSDIASYNFPGFGRYTLFYQFSDATKQDFSPVYQVDVNLTDLDGDYGLVIGDGSPVQYLSSLPVSVVAPPTTFMMRYADGEFALKGS